MLALVLVMPTVQAPLGFGITNPSFEDADRGWMIETGRVGDASGGPNRVEFLRGDAYEGETAARLVYQGTWLWLTTSPLPAEVYGKRLTVRAHVKWLSGASEISAGFTEFEKEARAWARAHDNLLIAEIPRDGKWHELEFCLDVPRFDTENRYLGVKIGCGHGRPAELLLDAVEITGVEPLPPAHPTPLMIDNPGGENDGAAWVWELSQGSRLSWPTGDAHSGNQCAELHFPGEGWAWLEMPLPDLRPGQEFTLKLWAKRLGDGSRLYLGFSEVSRARGEWVRAHDDLWHAEVPADGQWHELSATIQAPSYDSDANLLRVKIGVAGTKPPSAFRLDNLRIEGQPEEPPAPVFFDPPRMPIVGRQSGTGLQTGRVGEVIVTAPAVLRPPLGHLHALSMGLENRGPARARIALHLHGPLGVSMTGRTLHLDPGKSASLSLDFRTLQALPHEVLLEAVAGDSRGGLRIPVEPRRVFPVFGVVEHFDRTPPGPQRAERDGKLLFEMPCAAYRVDCGWGQIDPGAGQPYRFERTDWYVKLVREQGRSPVLMMLGYQPRWANPFDDPADEAKLAAHRRAIRAIVERYADAVDYWEAWNEPFGFWFLGDAEAWHAKAPAMLLAVQRTVWEAVRELDPTALVLTPGFIPDAFREGTPVARVIERLYEMGFDQYFDAMCVHNYPGWVPPSLMPYKLDGRPTLPVEQWQRLGAAADMTPLLHLMDRHGSRKPVWVTEFGGFNPRDERSQALACLRNLAIMLSQRVEGALYYELLDYPHDAHPPTLNLVRNRDLHRTLGFLAYQDMIRALTGARHTPEALALQAEEGVSSRSFVRGGERILLLWSDSREPRSCRVAWGGPVERVERVSWDPMRDPMRQAARLTAERELTMDLQPLEFAILIARLRDWETAH